MNSPQTRNAATSVVEPEHDTLALSERRIRCALAGICWVTALGVLLLPCIIVLACWPLEAPPAVSQSLALFIGVAVLLLLCQAAVRLVPARIGLMLTTCAMCFSAVSVYCHYTNIEIVPVWIKALVVGNRAYSTDRPRVLRQLKEQIGIYEFHGEHGYDHIAGTVGIHELPGYSVTYTIDENRCRALPNPIDSVGDVWFFGGSFTFGLGVEDDQCYPAVLQQQHWPNVRICNRSVNGWGTAHAYLALMELLRNRQRNPEFVVYAMIPHHVKRNWIRKSYVEHIIRLPKSMLLERRDKSSLRGHPHFEIEEGELVSKGLITSGELAADSPALRHVELPLTEAFLARMGNLCETDGIPFFVVLLPEIQAQPSEFADVRKILTKNEIRTLDLSDMPLLALSFDNIHPTVEMHQRLAEKIANSFIADSLEPATSSD